MEDFCLQTFMDLIEFGAILLVTVLALVTDEQWDCLRSCNVLGKRVSSWVFCCVIKM
jgi:hypothetical protein